MIRPPLPRWLLLPVTAAVVFLAVPLVALLARVPWMRLPALLSAPAAVDAFWLSLRTCAVTTLVSLVLGLPLALLLSRGKGRWAAAGRTLSTVPMVLPPVVAGLALLIAWVVNRHLWQLYAGALITAVSLPSLLADLNVVIAPFHDQAAVRERVEVMNRAGDWAARGPLDADAEHAIH